MRKLLILSLLFSTQVYAVDVMSSACGNTYEEALTSAKVSALDKVNGAWIHGDSYVRDNLFKETITQYNGGVIKSYEVVKQDSMCVIIKADVVPQSNKVESNSANVPSSMYRHLNGKVDEGNRLRQAVRVIDDRSKAIAFVAKNVEYKPSGDTTTVVIDGVVSIQEKWKNDYRNLQEMAGYFNLNSFYKEVKVSVKGLDSGTEVTSSNFSFYDQLSVYQITPTGVVINPDQTEMVRLTFKVPTSKLEHVDKFEVKFL